MKLLKLLQGERDPQQRQEIFEINRKAFMKWFLIGAKNLLKGTIPIDKQTPKFFERRVESHW